MLWIYHSYFITNEKKNLRPSEKHAIQYVWLIVRQLNCVEWETKSYYDGTKKCKKVKTYSFSRTMSNLEKSLKWKSDSLRRGEWTTGSEWAGLLWVDSSPLNLWEWLVVEELWVTGRHAEQPPTGAPPHETHTPDALQRIAKGAKIQPPQTERTTTTTTNNKHSPCHKTGSSTFG